MTDIRWHQRLQNFEKACQVLDRALQALKDQTEPAIREIMMLGVVQAFEVCVELGWKTLKDYLENESVDIPTPSAKSVLRAAAEIHLIQDAQVWIDMVDIRNFLSHQYNEEEFQKAVDLIESTYQDRLQDVLTLKDQS